MTDAPFASTGLHPEHIVALRDHKSLSQAEFGALFGIEGHQVHTWEGEGLPTGPAAVAVRAVAHAWGFEFPHVGGGRGPCEICQSEGYHQIDSLVVCRSCYLTPQASMEGVGYVVSLEGRFGEASELEVKAPATKGIVLPPSMFGPEDWKTAVRKLRDDEHQTGFQDFDDLVYIESIEQATEDRLKDEALRVLIEDLVPSGELELIGDAARLHIFRRNARPLQELVLRLGLLMARLSE
jgi:hypothetical protein